MNILKKIMIGCTMLALLSGCTYRYYLGLHGSSVKAFPYIHQGVTEDQDCLDCHHPDRNPTGPPTSHPKFTGCLKCHNDDLQ